MGGSLAGKEAEIRQNTVQMLLDGFLFRNLVFMDADERKDQDAANIHLERVVMMVLKICKERLKPELSKDCARQFALSD